MNEKIESVFKNRIPKPIGEFKKSAVLILLLEENGEIFMILEKRALNLRQQPGDICFPGGKCELNETPKETALRETIEELNISKEDINFIGEMDYLITPYNSIMYPFVAKIKHFNYSVNKDEVDHAFKIPLSFFFNNNPRYYELKVGPHLDENFPYELINGGRNYKFSSGKIDEYFYIYENHIIWGFTALIIKNFIDLLKPHL